MEWNFPKSFGQIRGIADAGIETFNGKEIRSLAREICQNSLDAAKNEDEAARVDFQCHAVDTKGIPGYKEYLSGINKSLAFWSSNNNRKSVAFLSTAKSMIDTHRSAVLRISDYNTKGLADPYGDTLNGWNALTKLDGGATKDDGAAGSFGIGKNAPFANSALRCVFYRTLNEKGEVATQGISRLLSYPEDIDNQQKTMKSGFGYYGDNTDDNNKPAKEVPEIEYLNKREETGTDVFVFGFKHADENWKEELTESLIDNFVVAYYNGKLESTIQIKETINKDTLLSMIKKYNCADSEYVYKVLNTDPDEKNYFERKMNFHGLGEVTLKLLIDNKQKLNKRILVVRKAGMKLFTLPKSSNTISYTGVLELKGQDLNAYFGSMETPSHDKWEPKRHEENPAEAKMYFEELKKWVNDTIYELSDVGNEEETVVEGLGGILSEDQRDSEPQGAEEDKTESLNDLLGEVEVVEQSGGSAIKGEFHSSSGKTATKKEKGTLGKEGNPGIRTKKGKKGTKKRKSHKGKVSPAGVDIVLSPQDSNKGGLESVDIDKVRIIKKNDEKYILTFSLPISVREGHIEITTVGENGSTSLLKLTDAKGLNNISKVAEADDTIYFEDIFADDAVKIEFSLATKQNYAMEVNVYEHN